MSASRTSPHSARPGSSRWPGFRRKKVTVAGRLHDGPRAAPVLPSRPLGTSTATTGLPEALMAATTSAATPSSGRDRPAPNSASTMRSAPASVAGAERLDRLAPARRHRGRVALQRVAARRADRGARGSPARAAAAPPRSRRRRCCRARRRRRSRARPRGQRGGRLGHGAAGILHQREPRHALRASARRVGAAHLGCGEQFVARQASSSRCRCREPSCARCDRRQHPKRARAANSSPSANICANAYLIGRFATCPGTLPCRYAKVLIAWRFVAA